MKTTDLWIQNIMSVVGYIIIGVGMAMVAMIPIAGLLPFFLIIAKDEGLCAKHPTLTVAVTTVTLAALLTAQLMGWYLLTS